MGELKTFDFSKPSGLTGSAADLLAHWLESCCSQLREAWSELSTAERKFQARFSESISFQKLREKLEPTSFAYQVSIGPTNMPGLLIMSRPLAVTYAAEMLGEHCDALMEDRDESPVEHSMIQYFFERLALLFGSAWPQKEPIRSSLGNKIPTPHRSRAFAPDKTMLVYRIIGEADFGEHEFFWVSPQDQLERMLSSADPTPLPTARKNKPRIEAIARSIPLQMTVVLGSAEIPVADLPGIAIGDLILLDRRIEEPIEIVVDQNVKFSGWPGRRGNRHAIQIATVH
jgi:flagellar motor switch protein FliM